MQIRLPGAALTAAVPVPDLHAVLLLRDGVDPVVGLAAIPVVVVVGGAVRPLEVTLLVKGAEKGGDRRAVFGGGDPAPMQPPSPCPVPCSPGTEGEAVTAHQRPNSTFGLYN